MAFELKEASSSVSPEQTLVTSYSVHRQGKYPTVIVTFAEVAKLLGDPISNVTGVDLDFDGAFEALDLPDWALTEGETSPHIGSILYDGGRQPIGTVTAVEGSIFYLSSPILSVPSEVCVQARAVTGSLAWASVTYGHNWEIQLPMEPPLVAQYVGQLLGGALFSSVKAVMTEMGLVFSDLDVLAAVESLALKGINIDTFLATQGEKIEKDRRIEALPEGINVLGNAP